MILRKYLDDIDKIKNQIDDNAQEILDVINLDELYKLDKKGVKNYVKKMLFDYWESKDKELNKAIELGQNKAKKLLNVID